MTWDLADHFTAVKWLAVYCVSIASASVLGMSAIPIHLPRSRRWIELVAGLLLVLLGVSYLLSNGFIFTKTLVDRLALLSLLFAFWIYLRVVPGATFSLSVWYSATAWVVTVIGLAQILGTDPIAAIGLPSDRRSATFGNVNMTAQFLGASLFFQLYVRQHVRSLTIKLVVEALIGATIVYVLILLNRSVWIGASLGLVALLLTRTLLSLGTCVRIAIVTASLFAVLPRLHAQIRPSSVGASKVAGELTNNFRNGAVARQLKAVGNVVTNKGKIRNANSRLMLWGTTLDLIRAEPFGIGPGNFEYGIVPHQSSRGENGPGLKEGVAFKSPHNDYLLIASENGVVVLVLALVVVGGVLGRVFVQNLSRPTAQGALVLGLAAFFSVEAMFQFPWDNAWAAYTMTLLLALAIHVSTTNARCWSLRSSAGLRTILGGATAAAIAVGGFRLVAANHITLRHNKDVALLELACRLDPGNWRACTLKAFRQFQSGDAHGAQSTLSTVLARQAYVYPAKKLLGQIELATGQTDSGCRTLEEYDAWFHRRSSVSAFVDANCSRRVAAAKPRGG